MAVDDGRDDKEDNKSAAHAPQAFPEHAARHVDVVYVRDIFDQAARCLVGLNDNYVAPIMGNDSENLSPGKWLSAPSRWNRRVH